MCQPNPSGTVAAQSAKTVSLSIAGIPRKIANLFKRKHNPNVISVCINGSPKTFGHPVNITDLVASLDLTGKRIAIECNGEIVPRSSFTQRLLADGDKIEVVVAVGGG